MGVNKQIYFVGNCFVALFINCQYPKIIQIIAYDNPFYFGADNIFGCLDSCYMRITDLV